MSNIPYVDNSEIPLSVLKSSLAGGDNDIKYNQLVHDLKSPVNSLKGILKFADTQIRDKEAKEYLYMINQCVDKLEEKIMNTLNMFQDGRDGIDRIPINFDALVRELFISLGHINGFSDVDIDTKIENNTTFYAAKPMLESIFQNLLENAIKYRNTNCSQSRINVSISDLEDGVRLVISDNGIGIKEAQLPHIFKANFKSVLTDNGSNGLGLFIVKKAVEKMRGTIEVKSVEGKGTSFTIDLPNDGKSVNYVGLNSEEELMCTR
ncbi:sensor histidine kinase [Fulvivirga imtechensis AK7]|uniref:histidine kinase n=2 Tax=Fulvivirga TaxID=396811 RepID=L8JRF8_9BACT|nr:sensor histidine kinase [Fulvivirga imtechensis AK7]